jgi:hypothetical protein
MSDTNVEEIAVNVSRSENRFLYPPTGPGLGIELIETVLPDLATPGKKSTMISL